MFKNTRDIPKIKSIKDILFPDKIIDKKVTKNNKVNINILILISLTFIRSIKPKNRKKENFWMKPPAIASVWKGPVNLFIYGLVKPNKSLPLKNWNIISILTNNDNNPNE